MISFKPRSGSISITAGETRGMNNLEPSALKGLNIKSSAPAGAGGQGDIHATGFPRGYSY